MHFVLQEIKNCLLLKVFLQLHFLLVLVVRARLHPVLARLHPALAHLRLALALLVALRSVVLVVHLVLAQVAFLVVQAVSLMNWLVRSVLGEPRCISG